jgi:phospholipid-translocating ATPase
MYGNRVKYALVLDGDTFDYILKDVYVEANFAYAASLSYTLIAYRFSPDQKAALARIMKKRFANEPILLAIGDGLNDTKMMHAVDVSIEVHNECILPSANGDIKVANLSSLKKLLLVHGRVITEKVEGLILYLFYASTFLGFPIFLYGFYCKFSGTAIYDSMLIFMFTFWFTFFSVLAYASFDGFQL